MADLLEPCAVQVACMVLWGPGGGDILRLPDGLELLIRYLRRIGFNARVRRHLSAIVNGGDFGVVALCRVILGLLVVGGRRLHHLGFVKGDGLFQRFCGLQHLPGDRSVSRGLQRFGASAVEAWRQLNADEVPQVVRSCLHARRLTIDVDGTVLCTGSKVGGAARGYNPHHRKVHSATIQSRPFWPKAVISCGCTIGRGM